MKWFAECWLINSGKTQRTALSKLLLITGITAAKSEQCWPGSLERLSQQERDKYNVKEKNELDRALRVNRVCLDFYLIISSLAESVVQLKTLEVIC